MVSQIVSFYRDRLTDRHGEIQADADTGRGKQTEADREGELLDET